MNYTSIIFEYPVYIDILILSWLWLAVIIFGIVLYRFIPVKILRISVSYIPFILAYLTEWINNWQLLAMGLLYALLVMRDIKALRVENNDDTKGICDNSQAKQEI